jgi:surface antigen
MKRFIAIAMSGILTVSVLSGCAGMTKQDTGTLVGGAVGAAVGSSIGKGEGRTAAIILGAIAGSMIGNRIGQYMDEQDRMKTAQVLEYNRTGQSTTWQNPDTGYQYDVTPTQTYQTAEGTPCREFTMDADIGGKKQQVYGTACRQADGSWKIIK